MFEELDRIHQEILQTYDLEGGINHVDGINLPSDVEVTECVKKLMNLLFPGFYIPDKIHAGNLKHWSGNLLDQIHGRLLGLVTKSICFGFPDCPHADHVAKAEQVVMELLGSIPQIRRLLKLDVNAAYMGDPAASSPEEVIVAYPSIQAVAMHRIAHELYLSEVPLIPRLISEYAKTRTGIDIHPGATIGESFFIDHGTRVKIYQGVTLGALSFRKNDKGELIKGLKRHPTIEDDVILYAGCNILGGSTVIGKGSVIGGNVWVTESVPPFTVITFDVTKQEYSRYQKGTPLDSDIFKGSGI